MVLINDNRVDNSMVKKTEIYSFIDYKKGNKYYSSHYLPYHYKFKY